MLAAAHSGIFYGRKRSVIKDKLTVRVPHGADKLHLGWTVRVIMGEAQLRLEVTTLFKAKSYVNTQSVNHVSEFQTLLK